MGTYSEHRDGRSGEHVVKPGGRARPDLFASGCNGRKILLVDDYEPILDVLSRVLHNLGMIDTAGDGEEALCRIHEGAYDVIVTDVDMPVMNGIEFFYQAVDENPALKERFLFFTGSPSPGSLAFFRENNLSYLTKPSHPRDVELAVAGVLNRGLPEATNREAGVAAAV